MDAPIVIPDEATSQSDPYNERLLQESLNALVRGRTVIVIAHLLAMVRDADQIVVPDNGHVIDVQKIYTFSNTK